MGNCLFIPSEGKIEYRNPCLLPGVDFTEALGASFTRSIPPGLRSSRNKKRKSATPGTPLTAVSLAHSHTHKNAHTSRRVTHTHICLPAQKDDRTS